jgi:flagellar basal-body rod modification protein FlgD
MTTTPLSNQPSGTQLPAGTTTPANYSMSPQDFIQMMITQLQNQDPLQPTSSDQLLSQMSEIGQMQSASSLQTTLQGLAQQNQIGAASSLIGKTVQGTDTDNNPIGGVVTSVQVATSGVSLDLDTGKTLDLSSVTSISPTASTSTASTVPAS